VARMRFVFVSNRPANRKEGPTNKVKRWES